MFTLSGIYFCRVKQAIIEQESRNNEHQGLWRRIQEQRENFCVILRIFLVMGVLWCSEIFIQSLPDGHWFAIISNTLTSFHGVYVFLIFACKKRLWINILIKFGWYDETHNRLSTQSTNSTNLSTPKSSTKSESMKKSSFERFEQIRASMPKKDF